MTTRWGRSCRLEDIYDYRDESGWYVSLWTDEPDEIKNWCLDNFRDHWEIRQSELQSTKPTWHSWLVDIKMDSDQDFMLLKLTWCV